MFIYRIVYLKKITKLHQIFIDETDELILGCCKGRSYIKL